MYSPQKLGGFLFLCCLLVALFLPPRPAPPPVQSGNPQGQLLPVAQRIDTFGRY